MNGFQNKIYNFVEEIHVPIVFKVLVVPYLKIVVLVVIVFIILTMTISKANEQILRKQ